MTLDDEFTQKVITSIQVPENRFHPLVHILGNPRIGSGTSIGLFSEINANGAEVVIGKSCDIASFVAINAADSHLKTIGLSDTIARKDIRIGNHVFVGSHTFIGGYVDIGDNSVVGAGTILINKGKIPPYSLIIGNPAVVREGYFRDKI